MLKGHSYLTRRLFCLPQHHTEGLFHKIDFHYLHHDIDILFFCSEALHWELFEHTNPKATVIVMSLDLQALEHYTDIFDIKRAIVHTHLLNPEVMYISYLTLF